MKKTKLKILLPILICLCVMPFAYSARPPSPLEPKIFFTWAPGASATFTDSPTEGVLIHVMHVIGSTYGAFTFVGVEDYYYDAGLWHLVDHWYTTNLAGGKTFAALLLKTDPDPTDVYDYYDVTYATIDMSSSSPDDLSVSVFTRGKRFTVQYFADTSVPITSGLTSVGCSPLLCGTKASRPLDHVVVTGIPVGAFSGGNFKYLQTMLFDQSLLS